MSEDALSSSPRLGLKWSKTSLFFVFNLHLFGGLMMLQNITDSLFFSTHGVAMLPTARLGLAATMLPLTIVYERFSAKDSTSRGFAPVIILCGAMVLGLATLNHFNSSVGSFTLMIATPVVQTFLLNEFWTFASRYFTIRESKRAFPQLFAAASLGGIVAGFATSTMAGVISTENLLYLWFGIELLNLAFIRAVQRHLKVVQSSDSSPRSRKPSRRLGAKRGGALRRLKAAIVERPLVFGIVGLSFVGAVVLFLAEYVYFDIFSRNYTDTDSLTEFLGFWSAVSSAANFTLSFLVLPRLASSLGVRNITVVQPLLSISVFISVLVAPVLGVAVASFLLIQSRNVVEETNEKLLYKGLAPAVAQQVRGRSEGAVKPIAAATAAGLLYLFGSPESVLMAAIGSHGSAAIVCVGGLFVCLGYIAVALVTRSAYPKAIVERIRTRTFDPEDVGVDVGMATSESMALLNEQLASKDAELVCFAAETLYAVEPVRAIALVRTRLSHDEPELTAELLNLLAKWAPETRSVSIPDTLPFLSSPNSRVRAAAIRALASVPDADMALVIAALDDESGDIRREAIAALCTHWDLMYVAKGASELHRLLHHEDARSRGHAVTVLGRLGDRRHLRMLTPLLSDPDEEVRLLTARTLNERVDPSCDFLVDEIVRELTGHKPAVRLQLIDTLLRIASPFAVGPMLRAAEGLPSGLRNRAAHFLSNHAVDNVDLLQSALNDPAKPHDERILSAEALSLCGRRYRTFLIEVARDELTEAYRTLRDRHLLQEEYGEGKDDERSLELFYLALNDRRKEALEIVIEIVGFASQHPDFDTIRTYCFSSDPVARAYAIEALENLADRPLFELLLPFLTLDPNDEIKVALGAVGTQLGLDKQIDDVLARRVDDRHHWIRACAIYCATKLVHPAAGEAAHHAVGDPDPILSETAVWALQVMKLDARPQ